MDKSTVEVRNGLGYSKRKKYAVILRLILLSAAGLCGCGMVDRGEREPETERMTVETESSMTQEQEQPYPVLLDSTEGLDLTVFSEGIFSVYNGKAYGFLTETGEMISDYEYELAYPFSQGLSCVRKDGKYGFINTKGEVEIPFIYDRVNSFSEGLAYFETGGRYGFIDRKGEEVFLLDCDSISSYQEGFAYFSIDGKYGYLDKNGKEAIPPGYDDADYFSDGIARVRKGGYFGAIDTQGREVIRAEYDDVVVDGPLIIVQTGNRYGCFDREGAVVLPAVYDEIHVQENEIIFSKDGKYGAADLKGNRITEPLYDFITLIPQKKACIVEQDNRFGMIDYEGHIIIPVIYEEISCRGVFPDMIFVMGDQGKYGFFHADEFSDGIYEKILFCYDEIGDYQDGLAVVRDGEKYGAVDREGKPVFDVKYDSIRLFKSGLAAVEKNEKYCLVDRDGAMIGNGEYDEIVQDAESYRVKKDERYGFLNAKGEEVIPAEYDFIDNWTVYQTYQCYIPVIWSGESNKDNILITGKPESGDLSPMLLQNEITPRISQFHEWVQSGSITVNDMESSHSVTAQELLREELSMRLYHIGDSSRPVLYVCSEPYVSTNFPLSHSAFLSIEEGRLEQLVSGYECGGSMGGDYVNLWFDREEEDVKIGISSSAGGFGGRASGLEIYSYKKGIVETINDFHTVTQETDLFLGQELLENPELFFDERGNPYTKDTVLEAEYVSEYRINEEQTTPGQYYEQLERYRLYR